MRIRRIQIGRFKNLRDFEASLDGASPVSVVVGRNGTGKSNLIEALTMIFRDLDLGITPDFDFVVEYECRGRDVRVEASGSPRRLAVAVDGKRSSRSALSGSATSERLLPDFVFGYYSGPSNRLATHYLQHQEAFSKALREGADSPFRRLFYARPLHSQFVLLAFFLSDEPDQVLRDYLRIEAFDSVLFVLKEPYWAQRKRASNDGNPRFWNARGAVASLLEQIWELSLAPLRITEDLSRSFGRRERKELLHLYLRDRSALVQLAQRSYNGSPQELFKAFESILSADLLSEVRVRVRMMDEESSLVFRELSEGEQQLLMVLGLLRFTTEAESLFLLDEPDTHLNPAWSLDYVRMLEEGAGSPGASSQLLMATHDPLVIAGLLKEQVLLLERDSNITTARHPLEDPQGQGVSGLLTSEIYGLTSDLDSITLAKVERHRLLVARDELNEYEKTELGRLTAELSDLGFTFSTRDPLYSEFERAMASEAADRGPVLSPSEQAAQASRAREVLREILGEVQE
jgi:predicted ATPase